MLGITISSLFLLFSLGGCCRWAAPTRFMRAKAESREEGLQDHAGIHGRAALCGRTAVGAQKEGPRKSGALRIRVRFELAN